VGEQNGVVYIAQVLKRNRTLKVLNLSENKIDVSGLVALSEALVRLSHLSLPPLNH
jgi:protein phosphatase 1 regulatory subunit 37